MIKNNVLPSYLCYYVPGGYLLLCQSFQGGECIAWWVRDWEPSCCHANLSFESSSSPPCLKCWYSLRFLTQINNCGTSVKGNSLISPLYIISSFYYHVVLSFGLWSELIVGLVINVWVKSKVAKSNTYLRNDRQDDCVGGSDAPLFIQRRLLFACRLLQARFAHHDCNHFILDEIFWK